MKMIMSVTLCLIILLPGLVLADQDIGTFAQTLMEPVSILSEFISTTSLLIGVSFLFGAFFKYMQYRVNPLAAPISTVIALLIMGVALVCLPLAYKLVDGGIPYTYPQSTVKK